MAFIATKSLQIGIGNGAALDVPVPGLYNDVGGNGFSPLRILSALVVDAPAASVLLLKFDGTTASGGNYDVWLPFTLAGPSLVVSIPVSCLRVSAYNAGAAPITFSFFFGANP